MATIDPGFALCFAASVVGGCFAGTTPRNPYLAPSDLTIWPTHTLHTLHIPLQYGRNRTHSPVCFYEPHHLLSATYWLSNYFLAGNIFCRPGNKSGFSYCPPILCMHRLDHMNCAVAWWKVEELKLESRRVAETVQLSFL